MVPRLAYLTPNTGTDGGLPSFPDPGNLKAKGILKEKCILRTEPVVEARASARLAQNREARHLPDGQDGHSASPVLSRPILIFVGAPHLSIHC